MTPEQTAAVKAVLGALVRFAYGPVTPGTPWQGFVTLTAEQHQALVDLVTP